MAMLKAWWNRGRMRLPSVGASWLDVKLGLRMLLRHPGLTLVAVFALSIGIPASLIPIHIIDAMGAELPFDEGDRIVGVRNRRLHVPGRDTRVRRAYRPGPENSTRGGAERRVAGSVRSDRQSQEKPGARVMRGLPAYAP